MGRSSAQPLAAGRVQRLFSSDTETDAQIIDRLEKSKTCDIVLN